MKCNKKIKNIEGEDGGGEERKEEKQIKRGDEEKKLFYSRSTSPSRKYDEYTNTKRKGN